jgi:alkaline phosphatase D
MSDGADLRLTRRRALGAAATGAAGVAVGGLTNHAALARERRLPVARDGSFKWGVSSGLPTPRGIVLWTRVGGLDRSSRVTLEVARDRGFRRTVFERRVNARRNRDFTVHAIVRDLKPQTEYFYRFSTRNSSSRIGRFRTLPPPDSNEAVRIGFFSCQNWQAGYYNAHTGLANERDLDLVICLGDYVYENATYEGPRKDKTGNNGDGDVQRLEEWRQKYRLYQSDEQLQDMHANHPFVAVWDDHEVEDNYAGDVPSSAAEEGKTNAGEPRRVSLLKRRENGYRAFFESMPRRHIKGERNRIYGSARFGRMAELFFLDERQYRDPQPCGDAVFRPCPESDAPGRRMLGGTQKNWLKKGLENTNAQWKLLGNQLMLMSFDVAPEVPVTLDSWDGYEAERAELAGHILDRGIEDVVALTGDIHTFFAGQITTTGRIDGTPAAVEFVGGSITSLGVKETFQNAPGVAELERAISVSDPHIRYADFDSRGYGVVTLKPNEAICEFKAPATALKKGSPVSRLARFRVASGSTDVERTD